MATAWEMVREFHEHYNLPLASQPSAEISPEQAQLRQDLIDEEVDELREAVKNNDIVEIADALADIVYIACGTAHVYGINLDQVFAEVHSSNMSKLGADGKPIYREDGKVLKGPDFRPPNIAHVLGLSTVDITDETIHQSKAAVS